MVCVRRMCVFRPMINLTQSRKHRESNVWQRRFWEHNIRDEADLERHLDYIHYNRVKHGVDEGSG